jgi:hypothetical protein
MGRTPSRTSLIAALALAAVLVACAQPGGTPPATDAPGETDGPAMASPERSVVELSPIPQPTEAAEETMPAAIGQLPEGLLAQILADAAERSGLPQSELEVVQASAVTWNDGSLGCPEPGMMYTMALVDGYRVVVAAGDEELNYHTDRSRTFKLCDKPQPPGEGDLNS